MCCAFTVELYSAIRKKKKYIVCGEIDATVDFYKLGQFHVFLSFVDPRSYIDK